MRVKPVAAHRLPELLRLMPKAELHMHIEGSLEPELIFALAKRNHMDFPFPDVEALRRAYVFNNLQSFLDIYHAGTTVLRTEQDFYDMAHAYLARAHADNVLHAEIFFDTQTHTGHGVEAGVVIRGLHRACVDAGTEFGISASLILCFLRHFSEQAAFECLEQALPLPKATEVMVTFVSQQRSKAVGASRFHGVPHSTVRVVPQQLAVMETLSSSGEGVLPALGRLGFP